MSKLEKHKQISWASQVGNASDLQGLEDDGLLENILLRGTADQTWLSFDNHGSIVIGRQGSVIGPKTLRNLHTLQVLQDVDVAMHEFASEQPVVGLSQGKACMQCGYSSTSAMSPGAVSPRLRHVTFAMCPGGLS